MNAALALALFALMATGGSMPARAQMDHSAHGTTRAPAGSTAATALADGIVKKIDKPNNKVTLSHGPLPNGMPAMTMVFRVKNPSWLSQMKEGQKIRFATEEIKGELTVVHFEPAP